ncbi:hypothetical protein SAMN06295905_0141 [Devosia lucknowensis]|uniref:Uncharacterized protein n=1 Tax=Devosia lucknowensis TaxID=1096929 RepID=A0A1Y6E895_9HYPH|nr:hypothetical protein [Devosia lucknowensis]SMQ58836.1 hypothetical protein SAMN06295905_0141 [Devosia lucknowensis]
MTHLSSDRYDIEAIKRSARLGGHVHRARAMVIAAVLSAFGLVAVAATVLTSVL